MSNGDLIHVEIAYALVAEQVVIGCDVPQGSTLQEGITRSGILARFPEIKLEELRVGIFGKLKTLTDVLRDGDRVEIYRPLIADPKEMRRQRAQEAKDAKAAART